MDQVKKYPILIKQALNEYAALLEQFPHPTYDIVLVFDDDHHQYLIRKLGWSDSSRIRQTVLHVALRDDKIWIEEDMTEDGIATYFLNQGVSNEAIVLGFQPPLMRPYTEFAVA